MENVKKDKFIIVIFMKINYVNSVKKIIYWLIKNVFKNLEFLIKIKILKIKIFYKFVKKIIFH